MARTLPVVALLALFSAAPPLAEAKTILLGTGGKKTKALERDLVELLDATSAPVVTEAKLAAGAKPPKKPKQRAKWLKDRAVGEGADFIVTAVVAGKKLTLAVLDRSGNELARQAFKLNPKLRLVGARREEVAEWLKAIAASVQEKQDREAAALAAMVGEGSSSAKPESPVPVVAPVEEGVGVGSAGDEAPASVEAEVSREAQGSGLFGLSFVLAHLRLDIAGLSRGLSYNDVITSNLRPYHAWFMPSLGGRLDLYPLAATGVGALQGFGVFGDFAFSFGSSARQGGGPSYPTKEIEVDVGGLYRLSLGPLVLIPSVGYQIRSFSLGAAADGTQETELPNVAYAGLGGGLALELPLFFDLTLLAGGELARMFAAGDIISPAYHHTGSVGSIGGSVGLRWAITRLVEVELVGRYLHYFLSFAPEPGDTFIAGGALDQFGEVRASARIPL